MNKNNLKLLLIYTFLSINMNNPWNLNAVKWLIHFKYSIFIQKIEPNIIIKK